jgi:hypothetical protein
MDEFYLYISSNDSVDLFTTNDSAEFKCYLGKNIDLRGEWKCGLKELYFYTASSKPSILYITCDICERSYTEGNYVPLLRRLVLPGLDDESYNIEFADTYYKRVTEKELTYITISIRGREGEARVLSKSTPALCVLHFKKV